ncbi:MAG: hypothetical protein AB8I08_03245 [Sandaracinaceae bacterium]
MSRSLLALAVCFGSVSTTSLMGCLITQEPSFDEPANFPPSVHGTATTPMFQTITRQVGPIDNPFPGDSGAASPFTRDVTISAIVRDANLLDELEGRIYVNLNRDEGPGTVTEIDIDGSAGTLERRIEFTVSRADLVPNCNRIELHVSREFQNLPSLEPVEDGMMEGTRRDLGIGVWFVGGFNDGNPTPDMTTCAGSQ